MACFSPKELLRGLISSANKSRATSAPMANAVRRMLPTPSESMRSLPSGYGRFRAPDSIVREVALFKDKTASRQRLAELERKAEQSDSGLLDPFEKSRKEPLADHVAAFRQHLESKGNSGQHVALTVARCEAAFSGCGFKLLGQLDADKVANWLKQRRDEGLGVATSNHHLVAVKEIGRASCRERVSVLV